MRVLQGILLSLWIHFTLVVLLNIGAVYIPRLFPPKPAERIEVEIVESQNETTAKEKQIVRQTITPDQYKVEESEDPLTFLSEQSQRVKKQTQALIKGMTKNRANQPSKDGSEASETQKDRGSKPLEKGDITAFAPQYRKTPSQDRRSAHMDQGLSTVGEALPNEVAVGSFTALNTDRYLFYSFYSRIEELIRFRWESAVRQSIDTTPPTNFKYNPSGVWNTHLEIWIKPNGEYHSAHLMKESGFKAFDQAAIQAFIQARLFPNPPKEMVESDGLIHLKYSFRVNYEPKVLVKSRE